MRTDNRQTSETTEHTQTDLSKHSNKKTHIQSQTEGHITTGHKRMDGSKTFGIGFLIVFLVFGVAHSIIYGEKYDNNPWG